jgi:hypothetical protein
MISIPTELEPSLLERDGRGLLVLVRWRHGGNSLGFHKVEDELDGSVSCSVQEDVLITNSGHFGHNLLCLCKFTISD